MGENKGRHWVENTRKTRNFRQETAEQHQRFRGRQLKAPRYRSPYMQCRQIAKRRRKAATRYFTKGTPRQEAAMPCHQPTEPMRYHTAKVLYAKSS